MPLLINAKDMRMQAFGKYLSAHRVLSAFSCPLKGQAVVGNKLMSILFAAKLGLQYRP